MLPPNSPGDLIWSNAWPLDSKMWATKVMRRRAGNNCAGLLFDHGGPFSGKSTADAPGRRALISRLEVQFVHVFGSQPGFPTLEQALAGARELNPNLDDASWRRIATCRSVMLVRVDRRASSEESQFRIADAAVEGPGGYRREDFRRFCLADKSDTDCWMRCHTNWMKDVASPSTCACSIPLKKGTRSSLLMVTQGRPALSST